MKKWTVFCLWELLLGGTIYGFLEVLARGWTHPSMVLLGGMCLVFGGILRRNLCVGKPVLAALSVTILILVLEFTCGVLVNMVLGWNVWDYSMEQNHLLGQICPRMGYCWFFLSFAVLGLDWLCVHVFFSPPFSMPIKQLPSPPAKEVEKEKFASA